MKKKTSPTFPKVVDEKHDINFHWPKVKIRPFYSLWATHKFTWTEGRTLSGGPLHNTGTTLLLSRSMWVVLSSLRKYYRRLDQQLSVHVYRRCGELEKVAQSLVLEHSKRKGGGGKGDGFSQQGGQNKYISFIFIVF